MWNNPTPTQTPATTPAGRYDLVGMQQTYEDIARERQQFEFRHQMLQAEKDVSDFRSERYRKMLENFNGIGGTGGGIGHDAAVAEAEDGQRSATITVAGSSGPRSVPAIPIAPATQSPIRWQPQQRRPQPSVVAHQDDNGHERHLRSVWTVILARALNDLTCLTEKWHLVAPSWRRSK